jgi:hypothetical protein
MRTTSKKVMIAAAVALVAVALAVPAKAACPIGQGLDTTAASVVSNPDFCGGYGCYEGAGGPLVSPNFKGVFWGLGAANPQVGLGSDSGLFTGGFTPTDQWLHTDTPTPYPGGLYHWPVWISKKDAPAGYHGPGSLPTWSEPIVDGCGPLNLTQRNCTCILLTDQWGGTGFFATLSAANEIGSGGTRFPPPAAGRYHLVPIPAPLLTGSSRDLASGDVFAQVTLGGFAGVPDSPEEGVYANDGCGNCLSGFQIFGAVAPRTGAPPPDAAFQPLPLASGAAQGITGFGGQVSVRADCSPAAEQNLYLKAVLVGEGATPFSTQHQASASGRAMAVPCGNNLATPGGRERGTRDDGGRERTRSR